MSFILQTNSISFDCRVSRPACLVANDASRRMSVRKFSAATCNEYMASPCQVTTSGDWSRGREDSTFRVADSTFFRNFGGFITRLLPPATVFL